MPEKPKFVLCDNCHEKIKENEMTTFCHSFIYYQNQNAHLMKVCVACKKFLQQEEKEEYDRNKIYDIS